MRGARGTGSTTVGAATGYGAFMDCVSLPPRINLRNVHDLPTRASTYAFTGCTSIRELHFSAAHRAEIEALPGYGIAFGAPNAVVKFDP